MSAFLQQDFTLLTTEAGSLTYHLVLAFAIAGAIPGAIHQSRIPGVRQAARMVVGLGGLLLIQLILFASTGLIWQGLFNPGDLLPMIDRVATLLSLVLILWLWAYPEPNRLGDATVGLVALITIAYIVMAGIWWFDQPIATPLSGTWVDWGIDYLALGIVLLGSLILLLRRSPGWGLGLAMLMGLGIGHLANQIFITPNSDYSGAIRLAQMASYPLLLALPTRLPVVDARGLALRPAVAPSKSQISTPDRRNIPLDIKTLRALLQVSADGNLETIAPILAKVVAHTLVADVCLLVTPPDAMGNMSMLGGYDLIRERNLPNISLGKELTPTLGAAIQGNRILKLPASSGSADMVYLGHHLSVQKVGHVLVVPIQLNNNGAEAGIVVLSPYTMRPWSEDDQSRLTELAESTAIYLKHSTALNDAQIELEQARKALEAAKSETDSALAEQRALIARLETQQVNSPAEQAQADSLLDLKEELRLALQEIALLSDNQSPVLAKDGAADLSKDEFAEIFALAEELRQPMSSLVGYTDVLLAESHGILGDRQRKIVERIRVSNERMTRLLDELIGNLNIDDTQPKQADIQEIDLKQAIQSAAAETQLTRQQRKIGLRIAVQDQMPKLQSNALALHKVLVQLLVNASKVSSPTTDVVMRGQVRAGDGEHDFILLQITDTGQGISQAELPHIFSHLAGERENTLSGTGGNAIGLPNVKSLVESLGGRILADCEPGRGTTFSILLPVKLS